MSEGQLAALLEALREAEQDRCNTQNAWILMALIVIALLVTLELIITFSTP